MSAAGLGHYEWLNEKLWQRLDALESRHQEIQRDQENAWRGLKIVLQDGLDHPEAWQRYCDVVADLERMTAQFADLHIRGA